jgi:hypothetical protein
MDFITPTHVFAFALFLITISACYKWIEKHLLQAMHRDPASYHDISNNFRLRYQKLYLHKSDERHVTFFDDSSTKAHLSKIKHHPHKIKE